MENAAPPKEDEVVESSQPNTELMSAKQCKFPGMTKNRRA
jgi:hypothetical protein